MPTDWEPCPGKITENIELLINFNVFCVVINFL